MNEEKNIDLSKLFYVTKKRKNIIIVITLVFTIIAAIVSFFVLPPVYEADVTTIVGKANDSNNSNVQYNDVMMYQDLTKTYSEIATSKLVETSAADKLGNGMTADKLDRLITVTPETNTQIIHITADGSTPEEAKNRVNALANAFVEKAPSVYNAGQVKIMDKGELPKAPIKPKKSINIAIAFILGLLGSIGLSFLLEYMDSTIKNEDDIKRYLDLPVIGAIPVNDEL